MDALGMDGRGKPSSTLHLPACTAATQSTTPARGLGHMESLKPTIAPTPNPNTNTTILFTTSKIHLAIGIGGAIFLALAIAVAAKGLGHKEREGKLAGEKHDRGESDGPPKTQEMKKDD
jgi:hypothetical protein